MFRPRYKDFAMPITFYPQIQNIGPEDGSLPLEKKILRPPVVRGP
jgi:hypothetical protein